MMGYAATIKIRISDGVTINFAKRRSGMPRERRRVPADIEAASAMTDQNVSNAACICVLAFFRASSGETRPASASLTFL